MTNFDEVKLVEFIANNVQFKNGKHVVDEERITEMNLSPKLQAALLRDLKNYQITIVKGSSKNRVQNLNDENKAIDNHYVDVTEAKKENKTSLEKNEGSNRFSNQKHSEVPTSQTEKITREDRSPYVRDFTYGEISTYDNQPYDDPVYSTIEYDENGNLVYEDYDSLDEYLEKEFIPNNIQTKKYKDKATGDIEFYSSIQLNRILQLRLSEEEVAYTINFLESRDIRVAGINSTLDAEFNNYDYITTYKSKNLPEVVPWEQQAEWFKQYSETKDLRIREKIVEANMRLVPFITYKLSIFYKVDINELNSFGYEALLSAIEYFDVTKGFKFSTYAYKVIKGFVYKNLPVLADFKHLQVYMDFIQASEAIKEVYEERGIDADVSQKEIIELIGNVNGYGKKKMENIEDEIKGAYVASIEDINDYELTDDNTLDNHFIQSISKDVIMDALSSLKENERNVLILRFGLVDGRTRTLEEVGAKLNLSGKRIRAIEARALRCLREPAARAKLRPLLDAYDEMNPVSSQRIIK